MAHNPRLNADCVIPAAGLSSRMGDWKPLMAYGDKTIIDASVSNALAACTRVILVIGYRGDELITRFKDHPDIKLVTNREYRHGMFSSIQAGVSQVQSDYFFITHADMPKISADIYIKLWRARQQGSVFPGNSQLGGHPVLVSADLKSTVINQTGCKNMKRVLERFPRTFLELEHEGIYLDVDTPEAYKALCHGNK